MTDLSVAFSYTPTVTFEGHEYYPAPFSAIPLSKPLRHGVIAVSVAATISVICSGLVAAHLTTHFVTSFWQKRTSITGNQYVMLVYHLILADLIQGVAFSLSWHWFRLNAVLAPSTFCTAQGWLINIGDVSSGLFVLVIAVHTYFGAVYGRRIHSRTFYILIAAAWLTALLITGIGSAVYGPRLFGRSSAWCWISFAHQTERVTLHYVWMMLVQLSTILLYATTFITLRIKTRRVARILRQQQNHLPPPSTPSFHSRIHLCLHKPQTRITQTSLPTTPSLLLHHRQRHRPPSTRAVSHVARLMLLYPACYLVLTLPIMTVRIWSMAHNSAVPPPAASCTGAALLASCGTVDVLLYTLTRSRLLAEVLPVGPASPVTSWGLTAGAGTGQGQSRGDSAVALSEGGREEEGGRSSRASRWLQGEARSVDRPVT